jgi:hypothetical protein
MKTFIGMIVGLGIMVASGSVLAEECYEKDTPNVSIGFCITNNSIYGDLLANTTNRNIAMRYLLVDISSDWGCYSKCQVVYGKKTYCTFTCMPKN